MAHYKGQLPEAIHTAIDERIKEVAAAREGDLSGDKFDAVEAILYRIARTVYASQLELFSEEQAEVNTIARIRDAMGNVSTQRVIKSKQASGQKGPDREGDEMSDRQAHEYRKLEDERAK